MVAQRTVCILQSGGGGAARLKEARKPIDYFRPSQLEELRDGCRTERDRALVEVLRSTGARRRSGPDQCGGHRLADGRHPDQRGEGRYRTIYLDEPARYYLQKYIAGRTDGSEALFVACRLPYGRLHNSGIRASSKQIAKRAEMQCRVYPHKCSRKTLGMNLKNSGVDLGCIQEILGHNPGVTARYYAESTPDTLRSVRKRVAA